MSDQSRFTEEDIQRWRTDGFVIMNHFYREDEIAPVLADYHRMYRQESEPCQSTQAADASPFMDNSLGEFNEQQFKNIDSFPYDGSPEMMMLSLHPALIEFSKRALGVDRVQLYQSHTWAKFTGHADYEQPFHCDFGNHTFTIPSDILAERCVDLLIYFTDVTDARGALHYVTKPDSDALLRPGAIAAPEDEQQRALRSREKSATCPAGSVVAHGIDTFHRGTNLTEPGGYRYSMTVGYKAAGNNNINYQVWQVAEGRNWAPVFELASPEQLECIGIPLPGDPYWNIRTLKLTQSRWPAWNMEDYFNAAGISR